MASEKRLLTEATARCADCDTRHGEMSLCPGELVATRPETQAWRGVYRTPHGDQAHVVRLTRVGEEWQARILTEPCVVWTLAGHPGPLRFRAATAAEAVTQATEHVRQHCRRLGHLPMEQPSPAEPRRKLSMAVLWGLHGPIRDAETENISAHGMFVVTPRPAQPGLLVALKLSVGESAIPLSARVVWHRRIAEGGHPAGMGVRLMKPPASYERFVQRLS